MMADASGNTIFNPRAAPPGGEMGTDILSLLERMSRATIRFIYQNARGETKSPPTQAYPAFRARLAESLRKHATGEKRFGCSPVRTDGTASWLAWDLDSHKPEDPPDRMPDALALVEKLARLGLACHVNRSRSGKGAHIVLFIEEPGMPKRDAVAMAAQIGLDFQERHPGGLDPFPKANQALYLPLFGGAPLLDLNGEPVAPDRIIFNPLKEVRALVPPTPERPVKVESRPAKRSNAHPSKRKPVPSYLPKPWMPGGQSHSFERANADDIADGHLFRGPLGLFQARRGARNKIAGCTAMHLLKAGKPFGDFQNWDSHNDPPLAEDEPEALGAWWRWALLHRKKGA